jgi:hypothetical protein
LTSTASAAVANVPSKETAIRLFTIISQVPGFVGLIQDPPTQGPPICGPYIGQMCHLCDATEAARSHRKRSMESSENPDHKSFPL